jgi:hypothetical protein
MFRERSHLYHLLGKTLGSIIGMIANVQGALYNITSYREMKMSVYEDGFSYQDMKK